MARKDLGSRDAKPAEPEEDHAPTPAREPSLKESLRSPLIATCIWIAVGFALYQLKWSVLFADLRVATALLLWLTFAVFFFLAYTFGAISERGQSLPLNRVSVVVISAYFAVSFAANGGIPVVQIFRGQPYDIYSFGIEGFHVLMLSFTGYYGLRALRSWLDASSASALMSYLWIFTLLAALANRSALSFFVFASLILYLRNRRLRLLRSALLVGVALAFLLVFGQFGNTRLSHQIQQDTGQIGSSSAILRYSHASRAFQETGLAPAWLWPYMYMSSPIANLNEAFDTTDGRLCGRDCNISGLVVHELMPDVAGSRVGEVLDVPEYDKSSFLIARDINASTTFGSAVGYAGLVGAGAVLLALVLLSIGSIRILRGSRVSEEGMAILATVLFFSFFENMIAYSPMSLQLVWVLVRARSNFRFL